MYKKYLIIPAFIPALIFFLGAVFIESSDAGGFKRDDLVERFRVRGEALVMSEDGKHVLSPTGESRVLSGFNKDGKLKRDWSSNSTDYGSFKVRHEWTIDANGGIKVKIEEFSEEEMDSKTGVGRDFKNPIGSETVEITDFAPVNYRVKGIPGKRVVIRFIPELSNDEKVDTIGKMKLMGKGVTIYDSEGAVWANELDFSETYTAITTHRGTLILSFTAFRGSEPAGIANGNKITLRMREYPRVILQGETDFVPPGMNARVFVKYLKERRTTSMNSVKLHEASDEQKLLERLK